MPTVGREAVPLLELNIQDTRAHCNVKLSCTQYPPAIEVGRLERIAVRVPINGFPLCYNIVLARFAHSNTRTANVSDISDNSNHRKA